MPVNTPHPDYDAHVDKWQRIRDVLSGTDEVKRRGTAYLPKPNGHTDEDYSGYVMRAEYYPATQRTVDGLAGAVFRREPSIKVEDEFVTMLSQITAKGTDLTTFAKMVVSETLSVGRYGALVDIRDGDNMPFVAGYDAESIINWRVGYVGRKPMTTLVVLREYSSKAKDDEFTAEIVTKYRVLSLSRFEDGPEQGKLVYTQRLYEVEKSKDGKEAAVLKETIIPRRRGEALDHIPFMFFGPTDLSQKVEKSPILDLVDTNLSHYRTSAELEEGAYFTGLPMYVISGRMMGEDNPGTFSVGSRKALRLDEGGSAQVLTVDGEGMGLLKEIMESKERRMAVLGARILEDQKSGVEAAATVSMRHRGENSLLSSLADTVSRGLTKVIDEMIWWSGKDNPESKIELNKDFVSAQLTGAELVHLTAAFQTGSIGPEVFFKALKDGERVPDGWTLEDWLADIEAGADAFERGMTNEGGGVVDGEDQGA